MPDNQAIMPFVEALPPLAAFEAHKRAHPDVKPALIKAARLAKEAFGVCLDIHAVYSIACEVLRISCSRDWLPAYAREIEAECDDITFTTRPCRYD